MTFDNGDGNEFRIVVRRREFFIPSLEGCEIE